MNLDTHAAIGPLLAAFVLALAAGPAAADHGSEHSNHVAPRLPPGQAPATAGLSKPAWVAQAAPARDRQPIDADARDGRDPTGQAQAVNRAPSQTPAR